MSLALLVLVAAASPGHDWFYTGRGDAIAWVDEAGGAASIGGFPVARTGRLLARVADDEALAALRALPEVAAVEALGRDGRVVRVRPRAGEDEVALSRALHGRAGVVWSHPDFAVRLVPAQVPNDPYFPDQWHLHNTGQRGWTPGVDIGAELAWSRTVGTGALIAVIDSGVQSTHPDLDVQLGFDYIGGDADSNPDPRDTDSGPHGTAVAGIAAAIGGNGVGVAGVAYGASVYGIRLIGGMTSLGDLYSAFAEAVDAGAWVLSNSWGYGMNCDPVPEMAVYTDAVQYAETMGRKGLGAAVVFAAGNNNCDIKNNALLAQPEVIAVAATNGDDFREGYSCFGAGVDVAAPSGTIVTTDLVGKAGWGPFRGDDDYQGSFSGTSAATPIVSGTVALMFAANPRLTAAKARTVLCQTADKIDVAHAGYDASGWSPYYGCGRVNAGAAVMAVANTAPPAPAVVAPTTEALADHVVLFWQPSPDADGDLLTYQVTWRVAGRVTAAVVDLPAGVTHLDLTDLLAVGDTVTFTVRATDLWGPGPPGAPTTFTVVAHPSPPAVAPAKGGCAVAGTGPTGGGAALLLLGALLSLARRRYR